MRAINEKIRCKDCGFIFDEPDVVYEDYETYGYVVYQRYEVCPVCKGWALEDYREYEDECEDDEDISDYC